ncbi:hypothetical protein ACLOJK_010783 [Asimina triloba]
MKSKQGRQGWRSRDGRAGEVGEARAARQVPNSVVDGSLEGKGRTAGVAGQGRGREEEDESTEKWPNRGEGGRKRKMALWKEDGDPAMANRRWRIRQWRMEMRGEAGAAAARTGDDEWKMKWEARALPCPKNEIYMRMQIGFGLM